MHILQEVTSNHTHIYLKNWMENTLICICKYTAGLKVIHDSLLRFEHMVYGYYLYMLLLIDVHYNLICSCIIL